MFFLSTWPVSSSTMRNACQEWDAAHIPRGRRSGPSHPDCRKPIQNQRCSFQHGLYCRRRCEMRARNGTRRTSRAGVDPGPPILTEKNHIKINIFPLNMACLVVDDAKCVPGMGRGAHPARTSEATPSGRGHPTCQKPMQSRHVSSQRGLSCRRLCEIRGRNGTRCTSRATGQNVALASAPRACVLKVALPLRRGAHFPLANSSSAWGALGLPRFSWNILGPPQGVVDPPGAS